MKATFWHTSMSLDYASVACDLTRTLGEGFGCRRGQLVSLFLLAVDQVRYHRCIIQAHIHVSGLKCRPCSTTLLRSKLTVSILRSMTTTFHKTYYRTSKLHSCVLRGRTCHEMPVYSPVLYLSYLENYQSHLSQIYNVLYIHEQKATCGITSNFDDCDYGKYDKLMCEATSPKQYLTELCIEKHWQADLQKYVFEHSSN